MPKLQWYINDSIVMSELIIEEIKKFTDSLLPSLGLELFDVEFKTEGHGWVLRVYIDAAEGITVDHCAQVSRELSAYLDVEDVIDFAYHLEVSSPGLERKLRSIEDFSKYVGEKARVKLQYAIENQKVFIGNIESVVDENIVLNLENGESVELSYSNIKKARLSL